MLHLVKRFFGSLVATPLNESESAWVEQVLYTKEFALWRSQAVTDQRHSYSIAKRFVSLRAQATRDEIAGALLHDIGKVDAHLGTIARVFATVLPLPTQRFIGYRHHQENGAKLLKTIGCSEITIALVNGYPDSEALQVLKRADRI
ncbi:MAG: hypothetical protein ABI570_04740 [Ilumatobacteraceae bacterium]